jgi:hypothetical protein
VPAAAVGDLARVRAALDRGAAVNYLRREPFDVFSMGGPDFRLGAPGTALAAAAAGDHVGVVEELLRRGADPNGQVAESASALMVCVKFDARRAAGALLTGGATVDARSEEKQWTSLHHAALHGHARFAALLLDAGADVGALTGDGDSPVFIAAKVVSMQLEPRDSVGAHLGKDPRDPATRAHVETIRLLMARGGACVFGGKKRGLGNVRGMGAEGRVQAMMMRMM